MVAAALIRQMPARPLCALALLLGVLPVSASAVRAQDAKPPDEFLQHASQSRARGPKSAAVFVYEFADFQCPFCAHFAEDIFPQIDSTYIQTGKVQWVFVNLPLPTHRNAWVAAEAAVCAGAVADRFWSMHNRLYASQSEWDDVADPGPILQRYAQEAGVPLAPYQACVAQDKVASLIVQDVLYASSAQVTGTPTFVVNNEETVVGVKSFAVWKQLLDKALANKGTAKRP